MAFWMVHLIAVGLLYWSLFGSADVDPDRARRRLEGHRKRVAWCYIVLGVVTIGAGVWMIAMSSRQPDVAAALGDVAASSWVASALGLMILGAGVMLLRSSPGAPDLAKLVGALLAGGFPIGTAVAFYAWRVLRKAQAPVPPVDVEGEEEDHSEF